MLLDKGNGNGIFFYFLKTDVQFQKSFFLLFSFLFFLKGTPKVQVNILYKKLGKQTLFYNIFTYLLYLIKSDKDIIN